MAAFHPSFTKKQAPFSEDPRRTAVSLDHQVVIYLFQKEKSTFADDTQPCILVKHHSAHFKGVQTLLLL